MQKGKFCIGGNSCAHCTAKRPREWCKWWCTTSTREVRSSRTCNRYSSCMQEALWVDLGGPWSTFVGLANRKEDLMVNEGSGTSLDTYLSNPHEGEVSFPKIESGVPIASHEQIRCNQHTNRVVDAWNLGGTEIMVYENRNCQRERD